jgi:hypothetical protein
MQQVDASIKVTNVAAVYATQLMELADRASNAKVINGIENDMQILMPVEIDETVSETVETETELETFETDEEA